MGRVSRARHDGARQRIAAQRAAAAQRARTRHRVLLAAGAIATVVVVVIALVVFKDASTAAPKAPPDDGPTAAALASVVSELTGVSAGVLDTVGAGSLTGDGIGVASRSATGYLTPLRGTPLVADGKPEVLYVGADFCPYCAALRWPLIVALSRFGTFSGLTTARSAIESGARQPEPYPATPTWTFYGSRYASKYLTFTAVETQTSIPDPKTGGYTGRQQLTIAQQAVMSAYDPAGSIPFIDIGNAYAELSVLPPYGPQDLAGLTWSQIADSLGDPSSSLAKGIDGSASYLTAAICQVTGNQPASACTAAVRSLEPQLGGP
jgi:thiol-disulfide isomerase/thioredoxin